MPALLGVPELSKTKHLIERALIFNVARKKKMLSGSCRLTFRLVPATITKAEGKVKGTS